MKEALTFLVGCIFIATGTCSSYGFERNRGGTWQRDNGQGGTLTRNATITNPQGESKTRTQSATATERRP